MKKSIIILAAIILVGFSTKVMAQNVSATTTAKSEIITQLSITNLTDMNFGKMTNTLAGTCELNTAGQRIPLGGVNLSGNTATNTVFDITGEASTSYSISMLSSITVTNTTGASETMIIDNLKLKTLTNTTERPASSATSSLSSAGLDKIILGGTLNVAAAQAKGIYESTNFTVTIAYN